MSSKKLDESRIINELEGSSLFFKQNPIQSTPPSEENDPVSAPGVVAPRPQNDDKRSTPPFLPIPAQGPLQAVSTATPSAPQISSQTDPRAPLPPNEEGAMNRTNEISERTVDRSDVRSNDLLNKQINDRLNERRGERTKVRHSFDILSGQMIALREIALNREITTGKRTLLGDLVQEALDLFIGKERIKDGSNVRPNKPSNERTSES